MNDGKICVSVCAATADELIEQIKRADEWADIVEIRFDLLTFDELNVFLNLLSELKSEMKAPILAAMHKSVEKHSIGEYLIPNNFPVWEKILASESIDYFDPFQGGITALLIEDWDNSENRAEHLKVFFENAQKLIFIFSHHDFDKVPPDLKDIYERMKTTPANIIKIAVQTNDITDTISIWKLQWGRFL